MVLLKQYKLSVAEQPTNRNRFKHMVRGDIMFTTTNNTDNDMPTVTHHASEATAGIAAKTAIGTGITATVFGGIGLQDWLMIVGIITTIATFVINWFYQHKRYVAAKIADEYLHHRKQDPSHMPEHEHHRESDEDVDSTAPK